MSKAHITSPLNETLDSLMEHVQNLSALAESKEDNLDIRCVIAICCVKYLASIRSLKTTPGAKEGLLHRAIGCSIDSAKLALLGLQQLGPSTKRSSVASLKNIVPDLLSNCERLESFLSEDQKQRCREDYQLEGFRRLARNEISEIEALIYTIDILQGNDPDKSELKQLAIIRKDLLNLHTTYRQVEKNRKIELGPSYFVLEKNLECFQNGERTLGQLRVGGVEYVPVYVEWKVMNCDPWEGQRLLNQISDLAAILTPERAKILNVLPCRGVVQRPYSENSIPCGFVYDIPEQKMVLKNQDMQSLRGYLNAAYRPSLSARFRLAGDLATCLFHLHGVGWLHKEIRSANVLFFPSRVGQRSLEKPKLMGLTYARSDQPNKKHISDKPNRHNDLWRHPEYQDAKENTKFRRRYDIFALGLVLLEIGRWKALDNIYKELKEQDTEFWPISDLAERLQDDQANKSIWRELRYHAGDQYANIVGACLSTELDSLDDGESLAYLRCKVVDCLKMASGFV